MLGVNIAIYIVNYKNWTYKLFAKKKKELVRD